MNRLGVTCSALLTAALLVGCGGGGGGGSGSGSGGSTLPSAPTAQTSAQQKTAPPTNSNAGGNSGQTPPGQQTTTTTSTDTGTSSGTGSTETAATGGTTDTSGSTGGTTDTSGSTGGTTDTSGSTGGTTDTGGTTGGSTGGTTDTGGSTGGTTDTGGSTGGTTGSTETGGVTSIPAPYKQSADSRVIYVSSSEGNDANSGLAPDAPKKTIAAGISLLRSGYPDWLLIKKGDTFNEGLGAWKKTGRSASEPMVIWTYGPGTERPLLKTGSSYALKCDGSSGTPTLLHSLVFCGLHLYAHTRDPDGPSFTGTAGSAGIQWLRHSQDIILDDLMIESYANGANVQNYDGTGVTNFTFRRCVIVDSYNIDPTHSQGIYCTGVTGLVIEDCVFDKNGWNEKVAGGQPTIYNHNMYLQHDNALDVIVRRNIVCRASSHGVMLRSGGLIEGNFCVRNPIQLFAGYDPPVANAKATIRNNVVLEGTDITDALPRGWGISLNQLTQATVQNNVVAHVLTNSSNRRSIEVFGFGSYSGNIVYDWSPGSTGKGWGETLNTAGPWTEPNRSVTTYCQSLGLPGTMDAFYQRIRAQSRDAYDPAFSPESLSAYIRGGFSPK